MIIDGPGIEYDHGIFFLVFPFSTVAGLIFKQLIR